MSLFEETFQEIESFGTDFDETANKIRIVTEYVASEYRINVQTANLNRLKDEAITYESTYDAICEATGECQGKLTKTASAVKRNAKDYFTRVHASLSKLSDNKDYQNTIDAAKKACEENPKLGSVKVEFTPYAEEASVILNGMNSVQKIISRGKTSKKLTESDSKKLDEINTNVNKRRDKMKNGKSTISMNAALSALSSLMISIKEYSKEKSEDTKSVSVDGMDPEAGRILVKASGLLEQLTKAYTAVNARGAMSLRAGIKSAMKHKPSETKESVTTELEEDENFDESWEDNEMSASAIINDVFTELANAASPAPEADGAVTESVEEMNANHRTYLQQLSAEILGEGTTESANDDYDDDVDGFLESAFQDMTSDNPDNDMNATFDRILTESGFDDDEKAELDAFAESFIGGDEDDKDDPEGEYND